MKDINATVIVNLKPSIDEIKRNLHKDARWGIGRAQREGLIIKKTTNEEDWKELYKIYEQTIICGGSAPESLESLKKNSVALFVCKKENKIIAGAGIFFKDIYNIKIPRLYFNASLKEYQKMQPNNLLYWACILWSKKKGFEEFDLGGWQINAKGHLQGINKFKEKWGKVIYFQKSYSIRKALGRKLVRNSKVFWWLNKKFKGRK